MLDSMMKENVERFVEIVPLQFVRRKPVPAAAAAVYRFPISSRRPSAGETVPRPTTVILIGIITTLVRMRETIADSLPVSSSALAVITFRPARSVIDANQLVVPLAGWNGAPFRLHKICATAKLSEARPWIVTGLFVRRPLRGETMVRFGRAPSVKFAISIMLERMMNVNDERLVETAPVQLVKLKPVAGV